MKLKIHDVKNKYLTRDTVVGTLLILILSAIFIYFVTNLDWEFADWTRVYYPAARSLLNPYFAITPERELYFFNPPWMAWIIFPFTLFPPKFALALWIILTIFLTIWCIKKLNGGMFAAILVLCSPVFIRLFINAQIDIVILLGFTLLVTSSPIYTQGIGLILMMIKPQVLSLGAFVHWLNLERQDKVRILIPITLITLVSFLIYGFWPAQLYEIRTLLSQNANVSIWPYGLPIGIVLFALALKKKNAYLGGIATYFFTPYIITHSLFAYTAVLFTQIPKKWSLLVFVILWGFALVAT